MEPPITSTAASERLRIDWRSVRRWVERGWLDGQVVGDRLVITEASVAAVEQRRERRAGPPPDLDDFDGEPPGPLADLDAYLPAADIDALHAMLAEAQEAAKSPEAARRWARETARKEAEQQAFITAYRRQFSL